MPDECQDEVRPECAVELREIHNELAMIRKAVIGNGGKGLKDTVAAHGLALKIIGAAVAIIAAAALTAAMAGCTAPTETISARLADVQSSVVAARKSIQDARSAVAEAKDVVPADSPAVGRLDCAEGHLGAAEDSIDDIGHAAAEAQRELPNVEDKAMWFDKLIVAMIWIAVAIVAVVLFLVARAACRRFGWLIPLPTKRAATMARKVLAGDADAREMIAARRAADPAFERAFGKTSRPPPVPAGT